MMIRLLSLTAALALVCGCTTVAAFAPQQRMAAAPSKQSANALFLSLFARKPTYNKTTQRWEKAPDDDGIYPYDPIGSLLRHGPSPFFTRISNPDEYEQAVLKYMATANVSRAEATGNMDAYLNNANDWSYQKMEEKKGAPKVDYTVLKTKQAILSSAWALLITPLVIRVIYKTIFQF